jgi:hypothetical protein
MSLNPRNLYLDFQEAANNFDCDLEESDLFIMSSRPRGQHMVPSEAKKHDVSDKSAAVAAKKKES